MTMARDLMTAGVHCIKPGDSMVDAAQQMAELNIGALPICGDDDRLRGMLTDRDIVVKVIAKHADPLSVKAGDLAQGAAITVDATDDVLKVMSVMSQYQIRRVPVLQDGHLVGIVAQADVATAVDNRATGSTVEAISTDF